MGHRLGLHRPHERLLNRPFSPLWGWFDPLLDGAEYGLPVRPSHLDANYITVREDDS